MLGLTSANEKTTELEGLKFGYTERGLKSFNVATMTSGHRHPCELHGGFRDAWC
jgi:hypothetical protein